MHTLIVVKGKWLVDRRKIKSILAFLKLKEKGVKRIEKG